MLAVAMVFSLISYEGVVANAANTSDDILITNSSGATAVSYTVDQAFEAGASVSFTLVLNETRAFAVWVLEDGLWSEEEAGGENYEAFAQGYSNTYTAEISATINHDCDCLVIWIQYRDATGSADTESDLTGMIATISNLTFQDSLYDVAFTNEGNAVTFSKNFTYSASAGDTISFTIELSGTYNIALWFLRDGSWSSADVLLVNTYESVDTQTFYVALEEDIENWTICIQIRDEDNINTAYTGDLSDLTVSFKDITVTEDTIILGQVKSGSSQQSYYYYEDVVSGSTVSFDISVYNSIDTDTSRFAVWVSGIYEDGTLTSSYLSVNGYKGSTTVTWTTTEDYVGFKILVEWRNSSSARAEYTDSTKTEYNDPVLLRQCTATITNFTTSYKLSGFAASGDNYAEKYVYVDILAGDTLTFDFAVTSDANYYVFWVYGLTVADDGSVTKTQIGSYNGVYTTADTPEVSYSWTFEDAYDGFRVVVRLRAEKNSNDSTSDFTSSYCQILNCAVTSPSYEDVTYLEDGSIQLANPNWANQVFYNFTTAVEEGTEISFDVLTNGISPYYAVWVYGMVEGESFDDGEGTALYAAAYEYDGSAETVDVTLTESYDSITVVVSFRSEKNANDYTTDYSNATVTISDLRIYTPEKEDPTYTLSLAYGSTSDSNTWYSLYLEGFSSTELAALTTSYYDAVVIYVDGMESEARLFGGTSYLELRVKYEWIENDVKTAASMAEAHVITLPAGTLIGDYELSEDCNIYISQTTMLALDNITLCLGSSKGAQDNNSRYLTTFGGITDEQNEAIAYQYLDIEIDGQLVSNGGVIYTSGTSRYFCVKYATLGISAYSEYGTHVFTIPAGTVIKTSSGNYLYVEEDYNIYIQSGYITDADNLTLTFDHAGAQDNLSRYLIYFDGASTSQLNSLNGKSVDLYVNGELVEDAGTFWNLSGTLGMTVSYDVLVSGATSYSEINCTIELAEGVLYSTIYLNEGINLLLSQSSIYPSKAVKTAGDAITTSVSGTILTISGTGTVTASDLSSVTATSITEIYVVAGPTAIDSGAFDGFTALTYVYFANTVKEVAEDAFTNCASGVTFRYTAGNEFDCGLENADVHLYYSYKMLTIGSSYGEDTNNYIYTLATTYFSSLEGRTEEDIAYDQVVIAEIYTGSGELSWRIGAINGTYLSTGTTAYYEKWSAEGVSIPTSADGSLTARQMYYALQDEYWDYVVIMQSADSSKTTSSFLTSTGEDGVADIDAIIAFAKQYNLNGTNSEFYWLQTWSYNYKLNSTDYSASIKSEFNMRNNITAAMQSAVQPRVTAGVLDGILNAGAAIEYLKLTFLNAEDTSYVNTHTNGTYNEGNYSNYFAIQRDTGHASVGLGRFTLGLAAFAQLQGLTNLEILDLDYACYTSNFEDYELSTKLTNSQTSTYAYMLWDELTENCQMEAYWAVVNALGNPYLTATDIYGEDTIIGDANGDLSLDLRDLVVYKKAAAGMAEMDEFINDLTGSGSITNEDAAVYRYLLLKYVDLGTNSKAEEEEEEDWGYYVTLDAASESSSSTRSAVIEQSVTAGSTISFTLNMSEDWDIMAVWLYMEDGTYLIADTFYDANGKTFYGVVTSDNDYFTIQVQFRSSDSEGTVDTGDHSDIEINLTNITITEDVMIIGNATLWNGYATTQKLDLGECTSMVLKISCDSTPYYALWVYGVDESGAATCLYGQELSGTEWVSFNWDTYYVSYYFTVGFRSGSNVKYCSSTVDRDEYGLVQRCYATISYINCEDIG